MGQSTPLFSIVIPTRNRAHCLPNAIKSALNQDFDDYEIIVVANHCDDNTREVVQQFNHPQLKLIETSCVLPMPDNWELAWSSARGDYVTLLCDDDALSPQALSLLAKHALKDLPPIVSWEDAIYYTPDGNQDDMKNTLQLFSYGDELIGDVATSAYLNELASFNFKWCSPIPKILNCVANRAFFENWRKKLGRLFFPIAPDYSFAWIALQVCPQIRVLNYPLTIRGISDNSIGSNALLGPASQAFFKEFGSFDFFKGTSLVLPLLFNHLAATYLRVNEALSAYLTPKNINQPQFMLALATQLNQCRDLLGKDWAAHHDTLVNYVEKAHPEMTIAVTEIFTKAPKPTVQAETFRQLHQRTAAMASVNPVILNEATKKYHGDEHYAAYTLGLKPEALIDQSGTFIYVFGERISAFNPYDISLKVDYYYRLLYRQQLAITKDKNKFASTNDQNETGLSSGKKISKAQTTLSRIFKSILRRVKEAI